MDIRTVRLREVAFKDVMVPVQADSSFIHTRISLPPPYATNIVAEISAGVDLQKGEVFWSLSAIDVATGELVVNAQEGLLPPNDSTHRGEGYVTYTVQPKAGVPTGTVITNTASIVFDNNEPIETAPVWNTIDAGAPNSAVATLAPVVPSDFPVSWFGTDAAGGSGMQGYDLYVSDNNGPYQLWLANTAANTAVYSGERGHRYQFYSLGRDNVGNLETPPAIADAWAQVSSNSPPTLTPITNQVAVVGGTLSITNLASDPNGAGQTLKFGLLQAPPRVSIDPESGVLRWTPLCAQGSTTNLITVIVTDNGIPPLSTTQSFIVSVVECVEASLGNAVVQAGRTNSVALSLLSTVELTNLSFHVLYPANRFTNLWVKAETNQVAAPFVTNQAAGNFFISFNLPQNRILHGPTNVGQLHFTALPGQPSAFVPLVISDVDGRKPTGQRVANAFGQPGRVVVIGVEPLLEANYESITSVLFTLYANPNRSYQVETTTNLPPTA